jgi:hypothetical protein
VNFPISAAIVLAVLATGANAQPAPQAPAPSSVLLTTCAECGVIRSVKRKESTSPLTAEERKSTAGLVASIPLGSGKPSMGSSTGMRDELKPPVVTYEVVVRLDDGRFQVVTQPDAENLREGDKVRIDRGKVVPRDAAR